MQGHGVVKEGILTLGPWGGKGGKQWEMVPPAADGRLSRILIRHGLAIDSLQFQHQTVDGGLQLSEKWGGDGGGNSDEIVLEVGEYLKYILGHYGNFGGGTVVKSLTFISNIKMYGPYGKSDGLSDGTSFCLPQTGSNMIVGFHGRSDKYLNSIGVYLRPIHSHTNGGSIGNVSAEVNNKDPCIGIGPWSIRLGPLSMECKPINLGPLIGINAIAQLIINFLIIAVLCKYLLN